MKIKLLQILFALAVFTLASCADSAQTNKFTTADLQKLRWIEGTWRGTGDVDKPFFERYRSKAIPCSRLTASKMKPWQR